jgi:peptidoglycan hydrolase-like protein with peptidoglycan-binding domain
MSRAKRPMRVTLAAVAVLAVAAAVAGAAGIGGSTTHGSQPRADAPAVTTQISRKTLVETFSAGGELGYGPATPIRSAAPGTVTWLPDVGAVISRGQPLLRADERPVPLLYGPLPMYRALALNVKGGDVRQFEQNLKALGYTGLTVDTEYDSSTVRAVKRWQADLGLPPTGVVDPGQVSYATGAIRVAQHSVRVGDPATGEVLSYTGTTKVVTLAVRVSAAAWAVKGAAVTVDLPGGRGVSGKVASVGTEVASGQSSDEGGTDGGTASTVPVTVTIADQKALSAYDKAPVSVRYVARERKDVLTVPVAALLALAEGGYGLQVVDGTDKLFVKVQVGLFADGQVEVEGAEIKVGMTVEMPG